MTDDKAKRKAQGRIEQSLRAGFLEEGYLKVGTVWDALREAGSEVEKVHGEMFQDHWMFSLVASAIARRLPEGFDERRKVTGAIKDCFEKEAIIEMAKEVADYAFSLPRKYEVLLPLLPGIDLKEEITLSKAVAIKLIEESMTEVGLGGLLSRGANVEQSHAFVSFRVEGFAFNQHEHHANALAISKFRQFSYLLAAEQKLGLKPVEGLALVSGRHIPRTFGYVSDLTSEDGERVKFELPPQLWEFLSSWQFTNMNDGDQLDNGSLRLMSRIASLFDMPEDDEHFLPSRTACEWGFESLMTENDTVRFVHLCIALEALLGGDINDERVSATLADRCAYLIGKTAQQRRFFRKRFRDMYKARSKLVHGNIVALKGRDRTHLGFAEVILKMVLDKELSMLKPNL